MTNEATGIICTIKKYRKRKKLSQTELAQRVGVRRQAIYDMESGRYLPNTAVALKLADVLGCSIEMLFIEEGGAPATAVHILESESGGTAISATGLIEATAKPLTMGATSEGLATSPADHPPHGHTDCHTDYQADYHTGRHTHYPPDCHTNASVTDSPNHMPHSLANDSQTSPPAASLTDSPTDYSINCSISGSTGCPTETAGFAFTPVNLSPASSHARSAHSHPLIPAPEKQNPKNQLASKRKKQSPQASNKPVRLALAQVRDKLIGIPLTARQGGTFPVQAADGTLLPDRSLTCSLSTAQLAKTLLILGCDPALGLLQDLVSRSAPIFRTHTVFASSKKSLLALSEGNAHIAATHFHSGNATDANMTAVRSLAGNTHPLVIAFAMQEEGLMVAPGNPFHIQDVDDLTNPAVRLVNREEGAALRSLLENRLRERGIATSAINGYESLTFSHNDGANLVLTGQADAVLGLRVVAEAHGLDFVPLAATRCDLVIPADLKEEQGVAILLNILQSSALQKELRDIPGYDPAITGTIISKK